MALIVHITKEDLAVWELSHKGKAPDGGSMFHYRPRPSSLITDELAGSIQAIVPQPLEDLVDQDVACHVNIEKGWMSRQVGSRPEVKFQLRRLNRLLEGEPRRLRLRIRAIDTSRRPARVILEEFNGEES